MATVLVTVRRAIAAAVLGTWISLGGACDERVHEVRLAFTDGPFGPRGFTCKEAGSDDFLVARALTYGRASLVVDYVALGGSPLCRPVKLLDWCRDNGCPLFSDLRACVDVPLGMFDPAPGKGPVGQALAQLAGAVVTERAPEEVILVRVVALAASCEELDALDGELPCDRLIGCANSCPVYLPATDEVPLDLDVSDDDCEAAVIVCASPDLGHPRFTCPAAP